MIIMISIHIFINMVTMVIIKFIIMALTKLSPATAFTLNLLFRNPVNSTMSGP